MRKRLTKIALGLSAIAALALGGAALASGGDGGSGGSGLGLDDGGSLQGNADISIDRAVDSARRAASGDIGEIDLEYYDGRLVYNVDVGTADVKVDAFNAAVLGSTRDD